jgi:hypothetical protein
MVAESSDLRSTGGTPRKPLAHQFIVMEKHYVEGHGTWGAGIVRNAWNSHQQNAFP